MDDASAEDRRARLGRNRPWIAGAALADTLAFAALAFLATRGQADNIAHAVLLRLALVALPAAALLSATLLPQGWKAALALTRAAPAPGCAAAQAGPRHPLWCDLAVLSLSVLAAALPVLLMLEASAAIAGTAAGLFAAQYGVSVAMARRPAQSHDSARP